MVSRRSLWSGTDCRRTVFGTVLAAAVVGILPGAASGQIVMSVPTTLTASPGQTITVPVNLNILGTQLDNAHGNGIGADSFVISFNSALASNVGTISLGALISDPADGFSNYTTNDTAGLIRAVTSSSVGTPGLPAGTSGALANILFTVSPTAAPGNYTFTLLPSSGSTTTSIVDNNFNTYDSTSGLTLVNGSLIVSPVPEPSSFLLITGASVAWAFIRRRTT